MKNKLLECPKWASYTLKNKDQWVFQDEGKKKKEQIFCGKWSKSVSHCVFSDFKELKISHTDYVIRKIRFYYLSLKEITLHLFLSEKTQTKLTKFVNKG